MFKRNLIADAVLQEFLDGFVESFETRHDIASVIELMVFDFVQERRPLLQQFLLIQRIATLKMFFFGTGRASSGSGSPPRAVAMPV